MKFLLPILAAVLGAMLGTAGTSCYMRSTQPPRLADINLADMPAPKPQAGYAYASGWIIRGHTGDSAFLFESEQDAEDFRTGAKAPMVPKHYELHGMPIVLQKSAAPDPVAIYGLLTDGPADSL